MEDLKTAAAMLRWAAANTDYNLGFIPVDKLDWKPGPAAKSPLEIMGEMISALRMMLPVLTGGEWTPAAFTRPVGLDDARSLFLAEAERYAEALEAAGPELHRQVTVAGAPLWGSRVVLFPLLDILHHHGQLAYIQSLLGDADNHFDTEAIRRAFGAP